MPAAERQWTDKERAILRIVQKNIPESLTPFADIAAQTGATEEEVLTLLRSMQQEGSIRRFGASIKHQKAGYTHNAMVAWIVPHDIVDAIGAEASKHPLISHCYFRPSSAPDWPYEFFTMIHGRNPEEYLQVVEELRASTPLKEYAVLESLKEMKKTSMVYF